MHNGARLWVRTADLSSAVLTTMITNAVRILPPPHRRRIVAIRSILLSESCPPVQYMEADVDIDPGWHRGHGGPDVDRGPAARCPEAWRRRQGRCLRHRDSRIGQEGPVGGRAHPRLKTASAAL